MLVDNGIVVIENAYRLMEKEGMKAIEAAKKGLVKLLIQLLSPQQLLLPHFFTPWLFGRD